MTFPRPPRLWHPPHLRRNGARVHVARQGIFTHAGEIAGHELLYRTAGHHGLAIDQWPARLQDRATEHVIAAAFWREPDITAPHPAFINVTRSFLLRHPGTLHCDPPRVVLEIVESAFVDDALVERVIELREAGFRVAIDDFVGSASQRRLLCIADFVKVDFRDLVRLGPALADAARVDHAALIAERIEDPETLEACVDLGFDLFQGFLFERPEVHERGDHEPEERRDADLADAEV